MRRLQQLLQARIIFTSDVLYFTFKKHVFTGKIAQGGLIWHCTWQKPGEQPHSIFQSRNAIQQQPYVRTFESLTDWTETCIQECLDEYHTRYSSWKRVRHQRTDQPMEVLFKHLQRRQMNSTNSGQERNVLLFEQIAAQQQHIETLKKTLSEWSTWFHEKFPDKPFPVMEEPPVEESVDSEGAAAQPFVLTSERGQYMVLHRVNEVAPQECVSWLKQNGPSSFQNILKTIQQPVVFEPTVQGTNTSAPADAQTSKRFLYEFFNESSVASSHGNRN
jgi:hypothetical protein